MKRTKTIYPGKIVYCFNSHKTKAGDGAQLVEYLCGVQGAQGLICGTAETGHSGKCPVVLAPAPRRGQQEDRKFKTIPNYLMSSRQA